MKRVSLKDIAKKAGVSTALVSYVLNGKHGGHRVSEDLAIKIRNIADELNYQPNEIARSLRKGTTKTVGLVVADIANPFFGHLARCIEDEALKLGFMVIMGSSDEDSEKSGLLINTLLNRQVDGFIIAPTEGTTKHINSILDRNIPLVLIDRFFPEIETSYVILNNFQSTFNATQFLIQKNFKNIAIVAYKSSLIHMKERIRGYEEAMKANKLSDNINIFEINLNNSVADIEKACNTIVSNGTSVNGIIFCTNLLSITGLKCLYKSNVKIPEDLAFIGFDGGDCFDLFYSPITYIKQPIEEMAKESVRVLTDYISTTENSKLSHIILKSKLIVRESV